jgi:YegS/Rv2252/BmrU family lipid kinase
MRHILYIINPISGRKNKSSLQILIESEMKNKEIRFSIAHSVANGDYNFLEEKISAENVTDIVIAGGDGTINQVIASLRHLKLRFGIIPCGSGNGLAFSAMIPKTPLLALQLIIQGKTQETDAFLVNDRFACMLCGLGFDAQVAHDFANDPRRGLATYIKKTVAHFFTAPTYPFDVRLREKELKSEAFFISIANSNQFGNNFRIAPKASLTDGLLDIVIVTKQNRLNLLFNTALQLCGLNALQQETINENAGIVYFQAEDLNIKNVGKAPVHIDGEPVEVIDELKIRILKNCFSLIVP